MQRSFKSIVLVACAVLLALGGSGLMPAPRALAEPAAPTATAQQIIYLDVNGKIRADAWQQTSQSLLPIWDSGGSNGWTNIVTGDFNGDGKADIVATKLNGNGTSSIRAFFPVLGFDNAVDPSDLPAGWQYHLLAAGNFQRLVGRDGTSGCWSLPTTTTAMPGHVLARWSIGTTACKTWPPATSTVTVFRI
jgi:hypothetical protein